MTTEQKTERTQAEQKQKIEYEQATVKVPKLVMDYLRATNKPDAEDPDWNEIKWIERAIVDSARAECEGMDFREWADVFGLTPIFWEILRDNQYKPTEAEPETESAN
jgi:hypothetical protein